MTSRARGVAAATLDKETPLYWSSGKFQLESDGLFAQTTLFRVYSRTLHYPILGDFCDHTTLLWDSRSMVRIQWSRPEALRRHAPKAIGRRAPRNFECRLTLLKLLSSIRLTRLESQKERRELARLSKTRQQFFLEEHRFDVIPLPCGGRTHGSPRVFRHYSRRQIFTIYSNKKRGNG